MMNIIISEIGVINPVEDGFSITLKKEYRDGLTAVKGFTHLDVIWWAHNSEGIQYPDKNVITKPYVKGPDKIGVFATRSQIRPNPIAITPIYVVKIDYGNGIIYTPYIDTEPGTPVLDIKPYQPSTNIIKNVSVPLWCRHWPKSVEDSANFNWENEFNF